MKKTQENFDQKVPGGTEDVGVHDVYVAAIAFALSGVPGCLACAVLVRWIRPHRLLAGALATCAASCVAIAAIVPDVHGAQRVPMSPLLAAATVCMFNSVSTGVFNILITTWAA